MAQGWLAQDEPVALEAKAMKLQFRLLPHERLTCSGCGELLEPGANVYMVPDKYVVLFNCEMCHCVTVDDERLALLVGNRRAAP